MNFKLHASYDYTRTETSGLFHGSTRNEMRVENLPPHQLYRTVEHARTEHMNIKK